MFEIWCRFQKWKKNLRKSFSFWDNWVWIGSYKFSSSWTRYLLSAVNVLTNTPKNSSNIRRSIFQTNFLEKDEETWSKCSRGDFSSIWDAFTCWLSRRVLKRRFLESGLTKIFKVCNFGKTLAMTMVLFFKRFKIWCKFQKCNKKCWKFFWFFR